MRNRYAAILMVPATYQPAHLPVTIGTYKTAYAARRALSRYHVTCTRYAGSAEHINTRRGNSSTRGFFGEVTKDGETVEYHPFNWTTIPSVGELGWSP